MKKLSMIAALLIMSLGCFAQVSGTKSGNVITEVVHPTTEADVTKNATLTDMTFKSKSGDVLKVWQSSNGKLFVVRKSKSGNYYKQYITVE